MQQTDIELNRLAEELTLHRDINEHGTICYYNEKGELHRVHGPAIFNIDGGEHWLQNNRLHRLDGPAVTYSSGMGYWFINGIQYTEEEFNTHPDVIAYAKSKQQ